MKIRPIRSDHDYEQALQRVDALWGSAVGSPLGDELEVLVTLIEAYEREHYPVDLPNPLEAIKFRLEQSGKDLRSLVGIIGQRTRVYEVMRGDRPLSLKMIRNLHRELGIPAEVLIQPSRVPHRARHQQPLTTTRRARLRESA
ncbi:MAG: helix-turn-helix domain-containing protein [Candidatus Korobacteraceae bacterium]|jgi:HTH-type transcriptional regulator/antitoxin HigA